MALIFGIDINPAARLGCGIMIDQGTGVVIGETAVVEDGVSMLQGVTLGGTGKDVGARHPKIREGVMIGAGAGVFGNIEVGTRAKIGAGSVVLKAVRLAAPPPECTPVWAPTKSRPATWIKVSARTKAVSKVPSIWHSNSVDASCRRLISARGFGGNQNAWPRRRDKPIDWNAISPSRSTSSRRWGAMTGWASASCPGHHRSNGILAMKSQALRGPAGLNGASDASADQD
jgi:hypothetical protein